MHGLYVVTNGTSGKRLYSDSLQTLSSGASLLQYRDKSNNFQKRLQDASRLKELCFLHNAYFIINDDIQLAKTSNAHGVHLGKDDNGISEARHTLGNNAIIGVSCYNDLALAHKAEKQGANYVAFGSFFNSPTKPDASKATVELLIQAKQELSIPICCIGGITLDNAPLLINNGADMIAVISAVFAQEDIKQVSHRFSTLFKKPRIKP